MKSPLRVSVLVLVVPLVCFSIAPRSRGAVPPGSPAPQERIVQSPEPPEAAFQSQPSVQATATIPGPLRSFLRIAGISQKANTVEVMPLVARNVFLLGYQGSGLGSRPTEYLILLRRYVQQARELSNLAGHDGVIRISNCGDATQLLGILGYKTAAECGKNTTYVETADPRRAFLTIDSGFPLPDLEKTLQDGTPFVYPYPNSQVPIVLTEREWAEASGGGGTDKENRLLIDSLLHDAALARLYYAWAHVDPETQAALLHSPGLKKLVPLSAALDFYGSYIRIESGRVIVPGGASAESEWKDLVGANPHAPGEFVPRLLAKDNGWLAAYFDSLSRIPPEQQAHFAESPRLHRCYDALRGKTLSPSATASVFRPDPTLLLLTTRMQWDPNGDPHVPGNLQAWKDILRQKNSTELAHAWNVDTKDWKNAPDGLLETMIALSRIGMEGTPAEAYLVLSEIDAKRPAAHRLSPATVELMAGKFNEFRNQYSIFSEFPELSDASITAFLTTAGALWKIQDHTMRGNAMGIFEANVMLWQILARQGEIPLSARDESWQSMIKPFAHITSSTQVFDAGRVSLGHVLHAATGETRRSQDEIVELIAGPRQTNSEGQRIHRELAERIRAVLDDQRLVSLDTLLALGDGMTPTPQGTPAGDRLVPLAEQLGEFQMPRPIFTSTERTTFTAGSYNNRHTEIEMHTDLAKILKSQVSGPELDQARGLLAPFLRDTLVGFSYAYYEPPGSQALHNNPLLIRSHDFSGETVMGTEESLWLTPRLFGAGSPAGGGAHLVGSLADLPYVLAQMEEDFIAPENVQALIWSDLVPSVLTNSVLPRWWNVSRDELHAVALYQRAGDEMLAASVKNDELRAKVILILSDRMIPQRAAQLDAALRAGQLTEVSAEITPADSFYLTAEFRRRFPDDSNSIGTAGRELQDLSRDHPTEITWARLSQDFGVPHPVLARTYARELINVRPFPMFQGYSSRLLAETWDSTNLYWARLADEMGYPPVTLNRLAPELTERMVAKIFATDLNDWPAILRAMHETGEEFRQGKVTSLPASFGSPQP
jgi:hypothetical protein